MRNTSKDNYINLDKVYTRKGDRGDTLLLNGRYVKKSSLQVESYGVLDEASAILGVVKVLLHNEEKKEVITEIQKKFIIMGAYLSAGTNYREFIKEEITQEDIRFIERKIDDYNKNLLPLHKFVIPGENILVANLHVARTIIRRAERRIVELFQNINFPKELLEYINRASDLIFVLSRLEKDEGIIELIRKKVVENLEKIEFDKKNNFSRMTLEISKRIICVGQRKAKDLRKDFVFTVLNSEGNLILQEKMDDALIVSIDISYKKAYTSVALRMATRKMMNLVKPGGELYTLQNDSRYVMLGGGSPLFIGNTLVGAIGVSGGTVEEDLKVLEECNKEFHRILEEKNGVN